MRLFLLSLILVLIPLVSFAGDIPCQTRPDVAGACRTVNGKLQFYNGNQDALILVYGTGEKLAVAPYRYAETDTFVAPANVRAYAGPDKPVHGDFLVCPLNRPRLGQTALVCIESATLN